jgi:hypothetical protein
VTDHATRDRARDVLIDALLNEPCSDEEPTADAILSALDAAGIGLYDKTTSVLLGSGNVTGKAPGFDPDAAGGMER